MPPKKNISQLIEPLLDGLAQDITERVVERVTKRLAALAPATAVPAPLLPDRPKKFLSFNDLMAFGVHYGRRWLDQLERKGRFPKRVRLGERRVVWLRTDIENWTNSKLISRPSVSTAVQAQLEAARKSRRPRRRRHLLRQP